MKRTGKKWEREGRERGRRNIAFCLCSLAHVCAEDGKIKRFKWTSPKIDAFCVEKDIRYRKTRHKDGVGERNDHSQRVRAAAALCEDLEISVITCGSIFIISHILKRVSRQIWVFPFRSWGDLDTARLRALPGDSSCPWTSVSANYSEGEFDLSLYHLCGCKWHTNLPCLTPMNVLISKYRKGQIVLIK